MAGQEGFDFDIEIRMGAGAYVCGEETALIESLEGQRGEPRNRPPFPIDTGYLGNPTIVNNVETFAWVVSILDRGPKWFQEHRHGEIAPGKSSSASPATASGRACTSSHGHYRHPVAQEVGGEGAKAAQVGGAAGQCVPAAHFDRTIAYEDIPTGGSIIFFGPHRDMLRVVENFLEFFVDESCGQCTPCREGVPKLLEGVKLLQQGRCSTHYLHELWRAGPVHAVGGQMRPGPIRPQRASVDCRAFPG